MKTNYISFKLPLLITLIFLLVTELTIAQDWYNTSWQYRRPVTVPNSGSALTDFQVKISLNTSNFDFNAANNDGSDIRITDSDGTTLLSYWIEEWNSNTSATIWIKVPALPIGGTTVYLYYGNNAASSASNGSATFKFFDDFNNPAPANWIRRLEYLSGNWGPSYVSHDWKYCSEMQQGALYYSIEKAQHGWSIESLDTEIEQEFDFIHSQINPNGTVIADGYLSAEPQYCYGLILSNLSLGYLYFKTTNPTLSTRCYNDMLLVFNYLRVTYPTVSTLSDAGGYGWQLVGYSNAWKAFTDFGNTTSSSQALTLVQNYSTTFLASQPGGSWTGASGIQEQLKRNFGVLKAYDVTGNASYLTAVKNNLDYILSSFWISSNGGLEWYSSPGSSDHFYECHQQWFMIAVKLLYNASGGTYNYLTQGEQAWHFLTDNNYTNIDMYVDNFVNHNAFFSYRQITSGGVIQVDPWKGSYEIGTALWGMALNYDWVSNYQSSHSTQAYNYLNEMVIQIKKTPANKGYYVQSGFALNINLWSKVGSPNVSIIQDNGNNVLRSIGPNSHNVYVASIDKSFNNFICEMKVKMTYDINNSCSPEVGFRHTNDNYRYITMLRGEAQNDLFLRKYYNGTGYINATAAKNYSANQYYKYKISANGNTLGLYLDDYLILNPTNAGGDVLTGGITLGNYGNSTYTVYYDDVRIRSYIAIDPITTIASKQFLNSEWTGAVDTDWSNANNWITSSVPQSYSLVTIPSSPTNQPHVTSGPASPSQCKNLTISSGSVVTIDQGKALTVTGILTNNAGNTGLVIKSDATGTGSLIVNNSVNATVERYLSENKWHYVSSPVDDPLANVFLGIYMMKWDEPSGAWTYITDPNFVMATDMQGFAVWSQSGMSGNTTVSFTGNLNTGFKSITTTNTAGAPIANDGYNFAGNPYPSSLDWDADEGSGWSRTAGNIDLSLYIWNQIYGNYGVYVKDGGTGTNDVDNIIPPHQGFFVHCSAATGSLGVDNGARIHDSKEILKSGGIATSLIKLKVEGNNYADEIIMQINPVAAIDLDPMDATKFHGSEGAPQFYSHSKDGKELSINSFPETEDYYVIPVGMEAGIYGVYTLTVNEIFGFDPTVSIYLEDVKEGVFIKLDGNSTYSFIASPVDEPLRFLLHMNGQLATPEIFSGLNGITIYSFNQDVYISSKSDLNGWVRIYDLLGKEIVNDKINNEMMKKINVIDQRGYMIVNVLTDEGSLNQKVFIK